MSETLEGFAADCRNILAADDSPAGREKIRVRLETVLRDSDFVARHLDRADAAERTILYEDPELGFCICAHVYRGEKHGMPHDHGDTWAIYGQAVGETEMTDWRLVSPHEGETPARAELVRRYTLRPGDARLYEIGDVHAPYRADTTKLIRIEGRNCDHVKRTPIVAVETAA